MSFPDLSGVSHEALARQSFLYYLKYVQGLKPYHHIRDMVDLLEGPDRQCAVVIPPGFGKSTIVSQNWPSHYLGNHPDRSILLLSNTDQQAKLFLDTNKVTMEHDEKWRKIFPDTAPAFDRGWSSRGLFLKWRRDPKTGLMLPDWRTKDATDKDPALSAFGVGGPVIGRRADVIIVDDPYSQDMARSDPQRGEFLNWFRQTLLSRLKPVPWAKIVVVMTRWHPDDVIAWMQMLNREEIKMAELAKTTTMELLTESE
jgi:hypothetical protein